MHVYMHSILVPSLFPLFLSFGMWSLRASEATCTLYLIDVDGEIHLKRVHVYALYPFSQALLLFSM